MQIGTLGVPDELARALREQWRQMNLFAIGLISVVYVSADSAIPILLGAKYTDATTHVVAFLPAALFLSWLYLFRNYIFVVHNYAVYVAAPIASMALYVALMFALLRKPEDAPIAGLLTAVALFVAVVFFSVALRHLASPAVLIRILAQVAWPSALAVLAVVPVRFVVEFLPFASYVAIVVYPTVAVAVFTISATAAGLLPRSTIRDLINRLKRGT
jgi:O-antigen/teichoic acid export membrane protein